MFLDNCGKFLLMSTFVDIYRCCPSCPCLLEFLVFLDQCSETTQSTRAFVNFLLSFLSSPPQVFIIALFSHRSLFRVPAGAGPRVPSMTLICSHVRVASCDVYDKKNPQPNTSGTNLTLGVCVHAERLDQHTLFRWWEALRAPKVAKCSRSIVWIGTPRMVETEEPNKQCGKLWMEMERFHGKAKERDQGAVVLVLDQTKTFERVSLPVVWTRATHFSFPTKILRVLCGCFEHQRRVQFEGCVAPHHFGHLARVQVELFASARCIRGCIE